CRDRLGELARAFEEKRDGGAAEAVGREPAVPGRSLFPGGCATLDEAAEQVFRGITAEQLADLDERVQAMIRQQFTALVHVCLTSANLLRNLEAARQARAGALVRGGLSALTAAVLFSAEPAEGPAAEEAIRAA